jgi:uracil-DNA glycosylase family protein
MTESAGTSSGAEALIDTAVGRRLSLPVLRAAAARCRACPLWRCGTQTVFGAGPSPAELMLVGEQPGDQEDRQGKPFVGPAGRLLSTALADAGLDGVPTYVTNAVKHFKWEARGKRRIHQKPNAVEIAACRPWLLAEIQVVRPQLLICLGATAAQGILGRSFKVTQQRGQVLSSPVAPHVLATVHPSSILRARDPQARHTELKRFVSDLRAAARWLR